MTNFFQILLKTFVFTQQIKYNIKICFHIQTLCNKYMITERHVTRYFKVNYL